MNVSVIIPAHNASQTLAETVESLRAQTHPGWEAIIIDDGSDDETAGIAAALKARDNRVRTVSQPKLGVSLARNKGIGLARFEWLLFLDADDWLLPTHLERLTQEIAAKPDLDAVYCGSARVTPDGAWINEEFIPQTDDMFSILARFSAFPIHACLVRRSPVERVGGFDPAFPPCEEWDLWQRIARTGAHFGAVPETLALYRVRPASASMDGVRMLTSGLQVLTLGHAADPRVPNPAPAYANGLSPDSLPGQKLHYACWPAGLVLGSGGDARPLLDFLKDEHEPGLYPHIIASAIFKAALLPTCRTQAAWPELWPRLEQPLREFLQALETHAPAASLARRVQAILERLIIDHAPAARPLTIGSMHAVRVEATQPIPDLHLPEPIERLHCTVEVEGRYLGVLELPVCDSFIPACVLADAIAAEFAWPLLGRFFEHTLYPQLDIEPEPGGAVLRRGELRLAEGLPEDRDILWSQLHDQIGWTIFLQELWGRPDWPGQRFYDPQPLDQAATQRCTDDGWLLIELSEDLPDVEVPGRELKVVLTVGGTALGVVTLPAEEEVVPAQALRAALTLAGGFELCCTAVREGLLGRSLAEPLSLRTRLAAAARSQCHDRDAALSLALTSQGSVVGWMAVPGFAPGAANALRRVLPPGEAGLILGRHAAAPSGSSASRRATLPAAAAGELLRMAAVAGEPVIRIPGAAARQERVVYAPGLMLRSAWPRPMPSRLRQSRPAETTRYGRGYFETLFATQPDPWRYTSQYEQTKYEQTLSLLPTGQFKRALELACAEGHFTTQLAPRVANLMAADISQVALERAARRCAGLDNIQFTRLDLAKDSLPGQFDLIVCSEVLYFIGDRETLQAVTRKLANALEPGGYLLTAHANLIVDEPDRAGFDWDAPFGAKVIAETLAHTAPLQLIKELRTPLYRIQLFQHTPASAQAQSQTLPQIIDLAEQPTSLPAELAAYVRWDGGQPRQSSAASPVTTDRLPILMYHQVAPTGSAALARWRITPDTFEEQLRYLREAGYYSLSLAEWQAAMAAKRPLPGRAIHLTFDDGYLDFLTYAWPLLKRYGFEATVFLVADQIGGSNTWAHGYGEKLPLLGWREIHRLQEEGVAFGSHSASHPYLTALSPERVVCEAARARAILERGLGQPVQAFAYPFGDVNQSVQRLIGACGYTFGLSCQPRLSRFNDSLLALPRLEVTGTDSLASFTAKLKP